MYVQNQDMYVQNQDIYVQNQAVNEYYFFTLHVKISTRNEADCAIGIFGILDPLNAKILQILGRNDKYQFIKESQLDKGRFFLSKYVLVLELIVAGYEKIHEFINFHNIFQLCKKY